VKVGDLIKDTYHFITRIYLVLEIEEEKGHTWVKLFGHRDGKVCEWEGYVSPEHLEVISESR